MDTTLEFIARWQAWVYPGLALYAAVKSGLLPLFAAALWFPVEPFWASDDFVALHYAQDTARAWSDLWGPQPG